MLIYTLFKALIEKIFDVKVAKNVELEFKKISKKS